MENKFIDDPLKVHLFDPIKQKILKTYVIVGDVPQYVRNAILTDSAKSNKILKEFYSSYKKKLYLGSSDTDNNINTNDTNSSSTDAINSAYSEYFGADDDLVINDEDLFDEITEVDIESVVKKPSAVRKKIAPISMDTPTDASMDIPTGVSMDTSTDYSIDSDTEYIFDVFIYPEDRITELKEKIFLATEIPIYRQHLVLSYKDSKIPTYSITLDGSYNIDINDLSKDTAYKIGGIPIDRTMYDFRDNMKIENLEYFMTANILSEHEIYLVDMNLLININLSAEISNDKYRRELFYYGFVAKYFPMLTKEVFDDYLIEESSLGQSYPHLARGHKELTVKYAAESVISNYNYAHTNRILDMAEKVPISITKMLAVVNTSMQSVNIRNLFDKLRVSKCVPMIYAYSLGSQNDKSSSVNLIKRFKQTEIKKIPAELRHGITLKINLAKKSKDEIRHMYLNIQDNGIYAVWSTWNEEDKYSFNDCMKIMKKFIDPIITDINKLGKYVFNGRGLDIMTNRNVLYSDLSISLFWKKLLNIRQFMMLRRYFEEYTKGGILRSGNNHPTGSYEFVFKKGMVEFDRSNLERVVARGDIITISNYYSYLSNATIKTRWNQLYSGRNATMMHRTSDIKFSVSNIKENEFMIFHNYILGFITKARSNKDITDTTVDYSKVKLLKKLQEQDPELYNMKKYGNVKNYSVLCQKGRPMIYTNEELDRLSKKQKDKLTKYHNFTTGKPAYYGCTDKVYSHLSFMVNAHPKGYCLPCCKKEESLITSKKGKINAICLRDHVYMGKDNNPYRHVMSYGKSIEPGRITHLPNASMVNLFYNTLEDKSTDYYIYGVPQSFPQGDYGIITSLSTLYGTSTGDFVSDLIAEMSVDNFKIIKNLFSSLLNGSLLDYFTSHKDFISVMQRIFIQQELMTISRVNFTEWNSVFIELMMHIKNTYVIVFEDKRSDGKFVDLFISNTMNSYMRYLRGMKPRYHHENYAFVVKRGNEYHPIVTADSSQYFSTGEFTQTIFRYSDEIINVIYTMIIAGSSVDTLNTQQIDLNIVKEFIDSTSKYKIVKKFINRRNLCYAVIITGRLGNLYLAVKYSPNIADKLVSDYEPYDPKSYNASYAAVMDFANYFNNYLEKVSKDVLGSNTKHTLYHKIIPERYLKYNDKIIGFIDKNNFNQYVEIKPNEIKKSAVIISVSYDYFEINRIIHERKEKRNAKISSKLGEALYKNYKYELFLGEFINFFNNEKNKPMRKKLVGLLSKYNLGKQYKAFYNDFNKLFEEYPDDKKIIDRQILSFRSRDTTRQELIESIDNTQYNFDKITFNKIKNLPKDKIAAELTKIADKFSTEMSIDTNNLEFKNIYLPCEYDKFEYCEGKRLIVDNRKALIDILASDLSNPLLSNYILSDIFSDNTIDYYNFEKYPNENILII